MTARARRGSRPPPAPRRRWDGDRRAARGGRGTASHFDAEFSVIVRAGRRWRNRGLSGPAQRSRRRHPAPLDRPRRRRDRRRTPAEANAAAAGDRRRARPCRRADGRVLRHAPTAPIVNEIAPRVHNSGHWTIEGAATSQFEQHLRRICGLPLGDPGLVAGGATMDNLIGGDVERWADLIAEPGARASPLQQGRSAPRTQDGPRHPARMTRPTLLERLRLSAAGRPRPACPICRAAASPWRRRRPPPRRSRCGRARRAAPASAPARVSAR